MAWTAPRTWVTGETVTAALMNAQVKDNFLETSAATVTTAGDIPYADAANSMGSRLAHAGASRLLVADASSGLAWRDSDGQNGDSSYTSADGVGAGSSITYEDLSDIDWGSGTTVAVTLTTDTKAMIWYGASDTRIDTAGKSVFVTYRISGATTFAAVDSLATIHESGAAEDRGTASRAHLDKGLTAGSNTFTIQARTNDATGVATIVRPWIMVQAL